MKKLQSCSSKICANQCKFRRSPPQTFTTPSVKSDVHHPRRSPPQTFTTPCVKSDVHHPRRSPPQTFTTSDVHHPRHSPPQTFTTPSVKSDVHHPRHSPPQTFTTSDIHHPRRSPPPILKCDIHQGCLDCRNILNAWTVGEFSFGGDDCRGWGMLVGGFFFLASNAQEHIYSKT